MTTCTELDSLMSKLPKEVKNKITANNNFYTFLERAYSYNANARLAEELSIDDPELAASATEIFDYSIAIARAEIETNRESIKEGKLPSHYEELTDYLESLIGRTKTALANFRGNNTTRKPKTNKLKNPRLSQLLDT
jgi:hypothetical protein